MNSIAHNLSLINQHIRQAEQLAARAPHSVQLLAVSKNKPSSDIIQAYHAGQRHFGENYLQEALCKQQQLLDYAISWHFIGPIQSNKTRQIAEHFDWVHSVDRIKIAQRLSAQRPAHLAPLNICIQVNISDEASKSGFRLQDLPEAVGIISALPQLSLRGVMAIPHPESDYDAQREPYRRLYQAVMALANPHLDTFSFGMSDDLQAAIVEGATIVRVGTALFGARQ